MAAAAAPKVHLSSTAWLRGRLSYTRGRRLRPVRAFLGVPYADPPPRRFTAPRALTLWRGERDATKFGPICPQDTSFLEKSALPQVFPANRDEHCQYLNVWAPPTSSRPLPVMVFIHGGAFVSGCSNFYQGTSLCTYHDVIVVSINYRLGPFGFLCTGDAEAPGNYGLLDQVEALRWLQTYIACFGGDPNNVTIFGESAGGVSVSLLVLSPLARGLFHKAISQSGTALLGLKSSPQAAGKMLARKLEEKGKTFSSTRETVAFLRDQTADWLVRTFGASFDAFMGTGMVTVEDEHLVPRDPLKTYAGGDKHSRVPYIMGFNSHEAAMFTIPVLMMTGQKIKDRAAVTDYLRTVLPRRLRDSPATADRVIDAIWQEYFAGRSGDGLVAGLVELQGDRMFILTTLQTAEAHAASGPATYVYHFSHRPSFSPYPRAIVPGADHAMDVFYVLGVPFANVSFPSFSSEDEAVSRHWMAYWANFATTGDPNGADLPEWQPFTRASPAALDMNPCPTMIPAPPGVKPARMRFWRETIPRILAESAAAKSKL